MALKLLPAIVRDDTVYTRVDACRNNSCRGWHLPVRYVEGGEVENSCLECELAGDYLDKLAGKFGPFPKSIYLPMG